MLIAAVLLAVLPIQAEASPRSGFLSWRPSWDAATIAAGAKPVNYVQGPDVTLLPDGDVLLAFNYGACCYSAPLDGRGECLGAIVYPASGAVPYWVPWYCSRDNPDGHEAAMPVLAQWGGEWQVFFGASRRSSLGQEGVARLATGIMAFRDPRQAPYEVNIDWWRDSRVNHMPLGVTVQGGKRMLWTADGWCGAVQARDLDSFNVRVPDQTMTYENHYECAWWTPSFIGIDTLGWLESWTPLEDWNASPNVVRWAAEPPENGFEWISREVLGYVVWNPAWDYPWTTFDCTFMHDGAGLIVEPRVTVCSISDGTWADKGTWIFWWSADPGAPVPATFGLPPGETLTERTPLRRHLTASPETTRETL